MLKIKLLILTISLFIVTVSAQEKKNSFISDQGVVISYELNLILKGKRKDKYKLTIKTVNPTAKDLYYAVKLHKNDQRKWIPSVVPMERGFAKIKIKNSLSWFGDGVPLIGDKTDLLIESHYILYELKKEKEYLSDSYFKVKTGTKPVVTNAFLTHLLILDKFDLELNSKMIDGKYLSSCNEEGIIEVFFRSTKKKGDYLIQIVNGKKYVWLRKNIATFIREDDADYWLTYNKKKHRFSYSIPDGLICKWAKKDSDLKDQATIPK